MRPLHHVTRQALMLAELSGARRFTDGQSLLAFREKRKRGWISAMPGDGPPLQVIAFVHRNQSLFELVREVGEGRAWIPGDRLDRYLDEPWTALRALRSLARVGLAVGGFAEGSVHLIAADPRGSNLVNESRHHTSRRGCNIRGLIEALLPCRNPSRSRVNATDTRRILVAEILDEEWDIDTEGLLEERAWIRLVSRWRVPGMKAADELQPA